jgi:hypothetical protein
MHSWRSTPYRSTFVPGQQLVREVDERFVRIDDDRRFARAAGSIEAGCWRETIVMTVDRDFRRSVFLSMQRALWDMVTPDLRVVAVQIEGKTIRVRFGYARPVTDFLRELVSEVETEVVADFLTDVTTEFSAEFVPVGTSRVFPGDWWWAYLRREQVDPEP